MFDKIIVVAGMSRGGTNVVWNLVQSHPKVFDTLYEINELFGKKTGISISNKCILELAAMLNIQVSRSSKIAEKIISQFMLHNFHHDPYNKYKFPGSLYQETEILNLIPCVKLVSAWEKNLQRKYLRRNDALKYLPAICRASKDYKIIFVVRNAFAQVEGWNRRNSGIINGAKWYNYYVGEYKNFVKSNPGKATLIKFEDCLQDPFKTSQKLFRFLDLEPTTLSNLRIALKPLQGSNRVQTNPTIKQKVWIGKDNWKEYLNSNISSLQKSQLDSSSISTISHICGSFIHEFGYDVA